VEDLRSDQRRIVVDFKGTPQLLDNHARLLESSQGERLTFALSGGVAEFLAEITAQYQVRDLMVEHPPIEETVAELYQRSHTAGQ
jgi:ABC-type uncharacterized transport system ATPase subunit